MSNIFVTFEALGKFILHGPQKLVYYHDSRLELRNIIVNTAPIVLESWQRTHSTLYNHQSHGITALINSKKHHGLKLKSDIK